MANQCCVCRKKIGMWDSGYSIVDGFNDYLLCNECNQFKNQLSQAKTHHARIQAEEHFSSFLSGNIPPVIRNYFIEQSKNWEQMHKVQQEVQARKQAEIQAFETNLSNLLLTTGSSFEGHRVIKYIDVICEEVVFKNSFFNRLSASSEDFGNSLTFAETELSGSSKLIARARDYVMAKFRNELVKRGANAALGIDFESSVGVDIVRVAIFGTAVTIEPIE